jgi:hypothetical protein
VAEKIKRSMAVYPSPVVMTGEVARLPSREDYSRSNWDGRYESWKGDYGYNITRVTNSVDYRPGEALSKNHIAALIDDGWTVTVLSGDKT